MPSPAGNGTQYNNAWLTNQIQIQKDLQQKNWELPNQIICSMALPIRETKYNKKRLGKESEKESQKIIT